MRYVSLFFRAFSAWYNLMVEVHYRIGSRNCILHFIKCWLHNGDYIILVPIVLVNSKIKIQSHISIRSTKKRRSAS